MRPPSVDAKPCCPRRRPRRGRARLGQRLLTVPTPLRLDHPRLWPAAGRPPHLVRSLHDASARSPLTAAPAGRTRRPHRDQVMATLHQQLNDLPDGAVVLAEDETRINLLPW